MICHTQKSYTCLLVWVCFNNKLLSAYIYEQCFCLIAVDIEYYAMGGVTLLTGGGMVGITILLILRF